ncbi:hypothetical protein GCM10027614_53310 [Micromonospora vulcania]
MLVISAVGDDVSGSADADSVGAPVCGVNTGPAGPADAEGVDVDVAPAFGWPPDRFEPVQE